MVSDIQQSIKTNKLNGLVGLLTKEDCMNSSKPSRSFNEFNGDYLSQPDDVKKITHFQTILNEKFGIDYSDNNHYHFINEVLRMQNQEESRESRRSFRSKFNNSLNNFNFYAKPKTPSKNDVDFILPKSTGHNDRWTYSGHYEKKRKIIKYYKSKDEAKREAKIINKLNNVPSLNNKLSSIDMCLTSLLNKNRRNKSKDAFDVALVFVDVRSFSNYGYDVALQSGTKKGTMQYAKYWLDTLAQLHTYGTKAITETKSDKIETPLYYLLDEKQKGNLDRLKKIYDKYDLKLSIDEEEVKKLDKIIREDSNNEFIHGDIKSGNIVGSYLVDFGNSGLGNGLYDYLRLFKSTDLVKHTFSEDEKKSFLKYYLQTKENHRTQAYGLDTVKLVDDQYLNKKLEVLDAIENLYKPLFDLYKSTHSDGRTLATLDLEEKFSEPNESILKQA